MSARPMARRLEDLWGWFAVTLFVLISLDMVTTLYAAWSVGTTGEANPFVRFALERGVLPYAAANLVAAAVAIGGFHALLGLLRSTDPPRDRYVEYAIGTWLGVLAGLGLLVVLNNLLVVAYGWSLASLL